MAPGAPRPQNMSAHHRVQGRRDLRNLAGAFHPSADAAQHRHLPLRLVNVADALTVKRRLGLAGDHQNPGRRIFRLVEAGNGVAGAWPGAGDHDPQVTGGAGVAICRVGAGLFVTDVDDAGLAEPVDGIQKRHVVDADNAEDMAHAHLGQALSDQVG
jgi:hypothetical protein